MSKEKQIEEMANDICTACGEHTGCSREFPCSMAFIEAEYLYKKGYRKQTDRYLIKESGEIVPLRKQSEPISCGHEKGGEWVQLPCKVGDILYVISQMKDKRILPFINEYEVTSISINRKSIVVYHGMDGFLKTFKQTDFGKTVFLTKEEAERAVTDKYVGGKMKGEKI